MKNNAQLESRGYGSILSRASKKTHLVLSLTPWTIIVFKSLRWSSLKNSASVHGGRLVICLVLTTVVQD